MAKNDQQEAFERVLASTLSRVLDFLKYAEAKNAALLTFASAWIIGSINLLNAAKPVSPDWYGAFTIALPFFALAAVTAIFSFLPKTLLSAFHKDPLQEKSLLYFGDAASFAPSAYRDRVREAYFPIDGESATKIYLDDISIQVAVNSQIVRRKLNFFHLGAVFIIIALFVLSVPILNISWRVVSPHIKVI